MADAALPKRPSTSRRWGRLALGTGLSAIFLVLAFKDVPFAAVGQALLLANPLLILLALACVIVTNLIKAARWQAILRPQAPSIGWRRLFAVILIGQAMNAFAPLRVGDIARAYMIEGVGVGAVLYSVVIEKAWDSLLLLTTLAGLALVMPLPVWLKQSGVVFSVALLAVLFMLMLAGRSSPRVIAASRGMEGRFAFLGRLGLTRRIESAAEVMRSLGQGHLVLVVLLWSLLGWALGIAVNGIMFAAMGLNVATAAIAATFLLIVLYLGAIVPSSPGKVGVFHYLVVLSLAVFAVDKAPALAYAVVLHLVVYGPIAVLGAYYVWRESQSRGRR